MTKQSNKIAKKHKNIKTKNEPNIPFIDTACFCIRKQTLSTADKYLWI
jgi:hypothetical protein